MKRGVFKASFVAILNLIPKMVSLETTKRRRNGAKKRTKQPNMKATWVWRWWGCQGNVFEGMKQKWRKERERNRKMAQKEKHACFLKRGWCRKMKKGRRKNNKKFWRKGFWGRRENLQNCKRRPFWAPSNTKKYKITQTKTYKKKLKLTTQKQNHKKEGLGDVRVALQATSPQPKPSKSQTPQKYNTNQKQTPKNMYQMHNTRNAKTLNYKHTQKTHKHHTTNHPNPNTHKTPEPNKNLFACSNQIHYLGKIFPFWQLRPFSLQKLCFAEKAIKIEISAEHSFWGSQIVKTLLETPSKNTHVQKTWIFGFPLCLLKPLSL